MNVIRLLLLLTFLLSGCAVQRYAPPAADDGPVARARFMAGAIPVIVYRLKDACLPWTAPDFVDGTQMVTTFTMFQNKNRTVLGMPMAAETGNSDFHETRLRASEPINFLGLLTGLAGGGLCEAGIQFVPEQGKDYEVLFYPLGTYYKCRLEVREIVSTDGATGTYRPVSVKNLEKCARPQATKSDPGALPSL